MSTAQIVTAEVIGFIFVFCRVAAILSTISFFGDINIPVRIKTLLYVIISVAIYGIVLSSKNSNLEEIIIEAQSSHSKFILTIIQESFLGYILGFIVSIIQSCLHVVGFIVANQAGLSSASMFDPAQNSEGTLISTGLSMFMLAFFLGLDLHILFIRALYASYDTFHVGSLSFILGNELFKQTVQIAGRTWLLALQISAPAIISSMLFLIGSGILSRLMPQLQIFFITMPLQLVLGIFCFGFILIYLIANFMESYWEIASHFFVLQ